MQLSDQPSDATQSELEAFRAQWKEEVASRKQQQKESQQKSQPQPDSSRAAAATSERKSPVTSPRTTITVDSLDKQFTSLSLDRHGEEPVAEESNPSLPQQSQERGTAQAGSALELYIAAVDNERQGKLGQAIKFYRQAFKIDPDIDTKYKKHYLTNIAPILHDRTTTAFDTSNSNKDDFRHIVPIGNEYVAPSATRSDPLEPLIQEISCQDLTYQPRLDYKPVLLARLPSEIVMRILEYVALQSVSYLANFGLSCKKNFLLTRSESLWRSLCKYEFKLPYMTLEESMIQQSIHVHRFGGNWRRMFIERPRIRYGGVYISTCNYFRSGISDTSYNQPLQTVTYYRYIRFFPNGTLLKYLSTDEPAKVVRLLTPDFRRRQVFLGRFELHENTIHMEMVDKRRPREQFRMSVVIKSTHRGLHNKLACQEYTSVSQGREDVVHTYDLKMIRPFFFSPVRSYTFDDMILDDTTE